MKMRSVALIGLLLGISISSYAGPAVTIFYEEDAQVELISSKGTRVLFDVRHPSKLSRPATKDDILLTTHAHPDHVDWGFLGGFKGEQLFAKTGEITTRDVAIKSLPSAHNEGDLVQQGNGTNYIFVVLMDGFRIAHLGDIGQAALTEEQLAALGKVDLAVMQFDNSYSGIDSTNRKGFIVMLQLKPRLIIPTHNSSIAAEYEGTLWPCFYTEKPSIKLRREILTDETRLIFMGKLAPGYAEYSGATPVDW
ncbi:MAG: MBL fold metallo-hydrolase [Spirochaetes bacterium]|nr:MBL fold metallo-hydrolase [Spirochaetota bacterium]